MPVENRRWRRRRIWPKRGGRRKEDVNPIETEGGGADGGLILSPAVAPPRPLEDVIADRLKDPDFPSTAAELRNLIREEIDKYFLGPWREKLKERRK